MEVASAKISSRVIAVRSFDSVMRRAHSSRSWVRFWRRWATSSRSSAAVDSGAWMTEACPARRARTRPTVSPSFMLFLLEGGGAALGASLERVDRSRPENPDPVSMEPAYGARNRVDSGAGPGERPGWGLRLHDALADRVAHQAGRLVDPELL